MIFSLLSPILYGWAVFHAAPAPAAVHAAPVAIIHTVAAPAVSPCAVPLAYLAAHANPAFVVSCTPGAFGAGVLDETTLYPAGGGNVVIGNTSCAIGWENEASNSWLQVSTLTGGTWNDHARHDASGRIVDPFGECG